VFGESLEAELWISSIVVHYPDPKCSPRGYRTRNGRGIGGDYSAAGRCDRNERTGVLKSFLNPELKLGKKIIPKLA
jgi:hypothetical protein